MAVSSTTATAYYNSRQSFLSPAPKFHVIFSSVTFASKKARKFSIKNSSDASAETAATKVDLDDEIEAPKGPPSLISALNVERALRGIAITDADYYGRLGIQRGCSSDQVTIAYNNKVEELMSQGLDEEELNKKLELLKESQSILSSEKERRLYDWSVARSEKPDRYLWPYEVDNTPKSTETPPQQEPEDVGPTRFVGYFFLAWLILAFTLSIALNR